MNQQVRLSIFQCLLLLPSVHAPKNHIKKQAFFFVAYAVFLLFDKQKTVVFLVEAHWHITEKKRKQKAFIDTCDTLYYAIVVRVHLRALAMVLRFKMVII